MMAFVLKRFLGGLAAMAGVVLIVFLIFMSGDPARLTLGQRSDVATLNAVKKEFGLDKPRIVQLGLYLNDLSPVSLLQNDSSILRNYKYSSIANLGSKILVIKWPYLRRSYQSGRLVGDILLDALPATAVLALAAFMIAVVLGVLFGVIAAVTRNAALENIIMLIANTGVSLPSFFAAIIIAWLFGYVWSRFTGLDMSGSLYEVDPYLGRHLALKNLILPAIALGIRPLAIITQLTRSSMLDVLSQDYVRTAYAKGLTKREVIYGHALHNALNPVVTAVSGWLASLMAGAFFIEYIFGWNGLGKVTVDALLVSDFPVVMGAVLFIALIFVAVNFLADIMYGILDPRIRLS
jgi:peptide/nickel transport system permease protein